MRLENFLSCVERGEIPDESPDGLDTYGHITMPYVSYSEARSVCTKHGMWAIVTKALARHLASWIGDRTVLEIMSGPGWLAKALHESGVQIGATDNGSWNTRHSLAPILFPVMQMDCVEAVRTIAADVLLVSWPPYDDDAICHAAELWGKPIIYIGEDYGGCNAPDEFFNRFSCERSDIPLFSWPGLHDGIYIGYYE